MNLIRSSARAPRLGRVALAGALAVALAAGCTSTAATSDDAATETTVAPPEGDPVDGGTLAVAIQNDVTGWNPTADQWGTAASFAGSSMMEPLTTLDAEANVQPWLATEWKANADFTSWTITLRDGVTFHDGTAFDAAAVVANFDDVLASPLTGIALGGAVTGATEIDPATVQIDLTEPWAAFPSSFLSGPNAWMRAPAMLGPDAQGSTNPIGTGPFEFESWETGGKLKLSKYDGYWREGEPHLDQVEFLPIVDDLSRVQALEAGDVDMMITTSARDAVDIDDDYQVIRDWDTETTLLVVNTREVAGGEPNPMSNEHARKAVAHATDAAAIAALIGDDVEVPVSPFSSGNPWGDTSVADAYPAHDIAKAKEEVEAYKQETGEPGLTVRVLGPTETNTIAVIQALQQQWSEAGIEAVIEAMDHSAYSLRGVQGNFQLTFGPIFSAPDPDQNFHFWSETTKAADGEIGINFSAYATETSQEALLRGRRSESFDERRAAYTDLISEQNEHAVNIWLFFTPYSLVTADRVHGLQQAQQIPFGNFQPKTWWGSVWVDS